MDICVGLCSTPEQNTRQYIFVTLSICALHGLSSHWRQREHFALSFDGAEWNFAYNNNNFIHLFVVLCTIEIWIAQWSTTVGYSLCFPCMNFRILFFFCRKKFLQRALVPADVDERTDCLTEIIQCHDKLTDTVKLINKCYSFQVIFPNRSHYLWSF